MSLDDPQKSKVYRLLFLGAWFAAAPLAMAVVAVKLLRAPPDLVATDLLGLIRAFIRDQEVPAGIVLFTFFEMGIAKQNGISQPQFW